MAIFKNNVTTVEKEIADLMAAEPPARRVTEFATASVRALQLPPYLTHDENVSDVGRLSAEAVAKEHEAAAVAVETMGKELMEAVKRCEAMSHDAMDAVHELNGTAQRYRDEAKRMFEQIEHCSLLTAEVRKTCADMREKIATPPAAKVTASE